jgi:dipeptidyl aminopeptidase/acylaminoacyl peptidase
MILPRTEGAKPVPFRATPFNDGNAHFSPDGKFISYVSNESGRNEVYVQPYPGPGRTWQISTTGGLDVQWRPDGKELYYRSPDQKLMAVEVQLAPVFQAGIPAASVPGAVVDRRVVDQVRPGPHRAEVPRQCHARPRRARADDRRAELAGGSGK